ncbi:MAG: alpha/beta hydrolase [Burkholderiales bacterium]|nr:alpha/beta hydrolase [Burkholderiales bacterium]
MVKAPKHLRPSDLRAVTQLATQATRGVTRIAEGVHQSVWNTMGISGRATELTGGLTGFVYRTVHDVTELVGEGLQAAFAKLEPLLGSLVDAPPETPEREAVLAALNGVMGDRLAANHNPLAMPMTLRYAGKALQWTAMPPMPGATGKVLVLIHGLCMNDLQWHSHAEDGTPVDHGSVLAAALGYTPVYVRYNTGLHTSENGHLFSQQLEQLVAHWPVPVSEITVVAHSMGGLVTRSALHSARAGGSRRWPGLLKNIVFLGTPHHGAPLERAGNLVDLVLGSTPFTRPFARLGQLRSAGITDLRYGHVLDTDWQGHDRFRHKPDARTPLPLPEGIACFTVAATVAGARSALAERLVGDGLVPLDSALGRHDDPERTLVFAKPSQWVVYRVNHLELLSSPLVSQKLVEWLTPGH